jgi:RNA polymerase sigma-70 factor (ECF subfamily)
MAAGGEKANFDRLVLEILPDALRFATRLTGDPDAAEDVLQDALVRASRSWRTFRQESSLRTWLFRIVINVFRDRLAARPPAESLPEGLHDDRQIDVSSLAMAAELAQIIAREVSTLPPRQREVLVLLSYEQLEPSEVASLLDISVSNVHATLHAARARLQKRLAPYLAHK